MQSVIDQWFDLARAWMPPGIQAPNQLTQSILQGWSLISINETNSKSPSTERAVVAQASYGRQLGRIMDAVELLIKDRPDRATAEPFVQLTAIADVVRKAKDEAAKARIDGLIADLDRLKAQDPDDFGRQREALKAYFTDA